MTEKGFLINSSKNYVPNILELKKVSEIQKGIKNETLFILENKEEINTKKLKFRTKESSETIEKYFEGKLRKGTPIKIIKFLDYLNFDDFLKLYNKESNNYNFGKNKPIEYYEKLLEILEKFKNKFGKDIKKYKEIKKNIINQIENNYSGKKESYLDRIINQNKKLKTIYLLLQNKNVVITYSDIDKNHTTLQIKLNNSDSIYEKIKISNQKLKLLFANEIDLLKLFRGQIKGKGTKEKLDILFENLNEDLLTLLVLFYKNKNNLELLKRLEKKLNSLNGKGKINQKFYIATKLELKKLRKPTENKDFTKELLKKIENNPKEAKKIFIRWINTKKEQEKLEIFLKNITENRGRNGAKKYTNKKILEKIIKIIKEKTNNSKNTQKILFILEQKLNEIETLIQNKAQ